MHIASTGWTNRRQAHGLLTHVDNRPQSFYGVDDVAWLRLIEQDIWKSVSSPHTQRAARRQFQGDELERMLRVIDKQDLLVTLYNACMGFGLGMSVYAMPPFPGADPVYVMACNSDHLICPTGTRKFDHAWGLWSPVAFSLRNLRLHRFQFGRKPPQDKSYYDY